MSIHLRFEMDMLAFAGCFDIFNPKEQEILKKYRKENFAPKKLVYEERRALGKCPLTPEEYMEPINIKDYYLALHRQLILSAMRFNNSTRIYLAAATLPTISLDTAPIMASGPQLDRIGKHKRTPPESFYTNSWPECFCQTSPKNPADKCPPDNVLEILDSQLSEVMDGLESNSTISVAEG
ncbi:hypothetical protein ACFX15_013026 [Malus domestica]